MMHYYYYYIQQSLVYENLCSSPIPQDTEYIYHVGVMVRINKDITLNVISVYFPKGPKNNNTDWLKSIDLKTNNWVILGDFNAHASFWDSGCSTVTSN